MFELDGQKVLVIGLGRSGRSAAAFCAARGAQVLAYDADPGVATTEPALPAQVRVQLGGAAPDPADFDLVCPSPGVAPARYAARAKRALGELELAFRALEAPIIAVTGTNGKSTTVRMIETMLRGCGMRAAAAGNLGEPALELVGEPLDVAVLEVSSFQLESVEAFRPRIAALLGCTPDHLDRHGDMAQYRAAKLKIFAKQQAEDTAIVNADDPALVHATKTLRAKRLLYSLKRPLPQGAWLDDGRLLLDTGAGAGARLALPACKLPAGPGLGNAAAALLCAVQAGADPEKAAAALKDFRPLPHRMETVAECGGVRWVDDSKATNPAAAAAALACLAAGDGGRLLWIAGGSDKGTGFDELCEAELSRVHRLLAIGESADALARALGERVVVEKTGTLERAVARARALAEPGDTVLLSPACASLDQFKNFEARGQRFCELVLGEAGA